MRHISFKQLMTRLVCLALILALVIGQPGTAAAENLETPVFVLANDYGADIATAVKVGQDYWAQVYIGLFSGAITLKISDPQGLYASWGVELFDKTKQLANLINTNTIEIFGLKPAGSSINGEPTVLVYAYNAAGEIAATYNLYISTSPAPADEQSQPEPELITSAVDVVHQTETGMELKRTQEEIDAGSARTFRAESFPGYTVAEGTPAEMTVSVDAAGYPSVNPVVFRYREIPSAATVTVTYTTESGAVLLQRPESFQA